MNNKTDGINNYTSSIKETEIRERKKKQEKYHKNSFSDKKCKEICQMLTFNTGKYLAREQTIAITHSEENRQNQEKCHHQRNKNRERQRSHESSSSQHLV